MSKSKATLVLLLSAVPAFAQAPDPVVEKVTFEEAVRRAVAHNPSIGQAQQAILRAEALLRESRSVFLPRVTAGVGTNVLDAARGFDGNVTQPRTQTVMNATAAFQIFNPERWAATGHASDQVGIARISAEETRRQIAQVAAESYLAVLLSERQREIAIRNRETARALEEYSRTRLEAGQGSRLNHVRSQYELTTSETLYEQSQLGVRRSQEALGVAIFAEGPVDADGDPEIAPRAASAEDDAALLAQRPDIRLLRAQVAAADRVVSDTWKSWLPAAVVGFSPQYVTPAGFFEPANTWRGFLQFQVPIYDGTLGSTRRLRIAERETTQLRLDQLTSQARSEVRFAHEAVERNEMIVTISRTGAEQAREALRITEIAYKAGASTNIEVVQAQQTARNAEVVAALAEDRLRQARLDLLVALGQFP
jgi:outer membrane protein TolC